MPSAPSECNLSDPWFFRVARTRHSGTSESSVMPVPFWRRVGEGGKLRLIVVRTRQNLQQRLERRVITVSHGGTQGFLNPMIARDERGISTPHRLRAHQGSH